MFHSCRLLAKPRPFRARVPSTPSLKSRRWAACILGRPLREVFGLVVISVLAPHPVERTTCSGVVCKRGSRPCLSVHSLPCLRSLVPGARARLGSTRTASLYSPPHSSPHVSFFPSLDWMYLSPALFNPSTFDKALRSTSTFCKASFDLLPSRLKQDGR